jgi:hypothetical protein
VVFNGVPSAVGSFKVKLAPDLVKPRVRAYGGSARRGRRRTSWRALPTIAARSGIE